MGTTKDIREAVEAELKFDPLVDDADIHVVNVNGDVALNGTVRSYPQYLEAAAATQRTSSSCPALKRGLHLPSRGNCRESTLKLPGGA